MKLSALATAVWLLWLAAIVAKISIGRNPKAIKSVAIDAGRATIIIAGTTAARIVSKDCPENVAAAAAYFSAIAVVAILFAPGPNLKARWAGTGAIVSATIITVAEVMLRSPHRCSKTAAPIIAASALRLDSDGRRSKISRARSLPTISSSWHCPLICRG